MCVFDEKCFAEVTSAMDDGTFLSNANNHKNVTALVGRNISLDCPIQERGNNKVRSAISIIILWKKVYLQVAWIKQNSRKIISLHGELVTQSNRYAIYKKNVDSVSLVVTNVKLDDAGTYICQVNSNPMVNLVCIRIQSMNYV